MSAPLRPLEPHRSALHFFGAELRHRRIEAGFSVAALAGKVFVSATMLGKVETADRFASLHLATGCDAVLDAAGALVRLHAFANAERERHQAGQQFSAGLRPAETAQLRRLLAAISLVTAAEPMMPGSDLLDRIDGVLSTADGLTAMHARRASTRVRTVS